MKVKNVLKNLPTTTFQLTHSQLLEGLKCESK
jgi:hypothetical protein